MRIQANSFLVPEIIKERVRSSLEINQIVPSFIEGTVQYNESIQRLISNEIELLIMPMDMIPLERSKEVKIWALCERLKSNYMILVSKEKEDSSNRIPVPLNSVVYIDKNFIPNGLSQIRPDIEFQSEELATLIQDIHSGNIPFAVIASMYVSAAILEKYSILDLNEREFGHTAGLGALALIAKEDTSYGNILRSNYHAKTISECNIERTIAGKIDGKTNIHVEKDNNGHFHLWLINSMDGNIRKAHFSQSTSIGIVEKAISELNN